jgi:thioredoxin-like negative regulator of GroEL
MEDDPDIRSLIEKYEQMRAIGKKIYFDAAEFAALAEHYNAMGYCEEADALIYEGLMMHPGNPELMMLKAETYIDEEMYREALKYMEGIPEDGEQMALLRIEAWMGLGNRAAADKIINDTLNKDLPLDEFYEFVIHLGFLLIDAGFFERAIQYLE